MLWLCPANVLAELKSQEAWNEAITSSKYELQLRAVQRTRDIADSVRIPASTSAEPPG